MTITEFHNSFKFGLDKFDSLNYPNFLPAEIDLLLNQAQDMFVKQRYGSNNIKKQSFEETQKRFEDLKNVVVRVNLTPNAYSADNINSDARFVTLPTDHWIIVQELTELQFVECGVTKTDSVYTIATQHNDYSKLIDNPFGKPNNAKVLRLMDSGKVELIPPTGSTITGYKLTYIKKPVRMSLTSGVTCELSDMVHQEIVNLAVSIALEGIESKRLQTFIPTVENREE